MMSEQPAKREIILPVITLKSGTFKYKEKKKTNIRKKDDTKNRLYPDINTNDSSQNNEASDITCSLLYEEGTSKLFFKIPDQKLFKKKGEVKYSMLECTNISAADLRITTKFGSWDAMSCRLLIECSHPLVAWSTIMTRQPELEIQDEEGNKASDDSSMSADSERVLSPQVNANVQTTYIATPQESCMVKATFNLSYAPNLRDILHAVKLAKLKERKVLQEKHKRGVDKHLSIPTKIREGLPEWVNYIPAKWYSSTVRKVIEYMLVVYTILTLSWAVWQLYKHVDFIQKYLRPILEFVEFYLEILKSWFKWLDSFAEALSAYWWTYMKPVYLLATPLYVALAQLFKPLRNVAGLVSVVCEPIIKSFQAIVTVLKPLFQSTSGVFGFIFQAFRRVFETFTFVWNMVMSTAAARFFIGKCQQLGSSRIVNEIMHGGLDPFRAQVIVIRDILLRSIRQILYGVRFIFTRIYFMHIFVKREREYANEEHAIVDGKEKEE